MQRQQTLTRENLQDSKNTGVLKEASCDFFCPIISTHEFYVDLKRSNYESAATQRHFYFNIFGEKILLNNTETEADLLKLLRSSYVKHYVPNADKKAEEDLQLMTCSISQLVNNPVTSLVGATVAQVDRRITANAKSVESVFNFPELSVEVTEGNIELKLQDEMSAGIVAIVNNASTTKFAIEDYSDEADYKVRLLRPRAALEQAREHAATVEPERKAYAEGIIKREEAVLAETPTKASHPSRNLRFQYITVRGDIIPAYLKQQSAPELTNRFAGQFTAGPRLSHLNKNESRAVDRLNAQRKIEHKKRSRLQAFGWGLIGVGIALLGVGISLIPGVGHVPGAWVTYIGITIALGCFSKALSKWCSDPVPATRDDLPVEVVEQPAAIPDKPKIDLTDSLVRRRTVSGNSLVVASAAEDKVLAKIADIVANDGAPVVAADNNIADVEEPVAAEKSGLLRRSNRTSSR